METERLVLRHYEKSEREHLIGLLTDEKVMKFVDTGVYSLEKAESLWNRLIEDYYSTGIRTIFGAFDKTDGHFIGHASIRPRTTNRDEWEIGYILRPDKWGKGLATEIARTLVEFGFDKLNLKAVYATVDTDNYASIRILDKIGMVRIRDEFDEQGVFYVYGITL